MGKAERQAALPLGTVLGNSYRLVRRVAEGGMGTVYEAQQLRLDRRCAIKVMSRELSASTEALARFHREANISSQLCHPHIIQVTDFGTAGTGEPFMVMEYLEGEDLARRLRRTGVLPLPVVASIVRQTASALAATHARGIVHRDLKPANIFLIALGDEGDFVKVVDFGISKIKGTALRLTRASVLMGTPSYMAPEQATGSIDAIDARTDQWALACIAWEMLTGSGPFAGGDLTELLYQIVHQEPAVTRGRALGLPPAVDTVLRRALSKRQRQRFASVTAFARAFADAVAAPLGEPTGSGKLAATPPTSGTGRRHHAASGETRMVRLANWSRTMLRRMTPLAAPPLAFLTQMRPIVFGPRRWPRRRRWIAGALGAAVVTGGVLWAEQRPLSTGARKGPPPLVTPASAVVPAGPAVNGSKSARHRARPRVD